MSTGDNWNCHPEPEHPQINHLPKPSGRAHMASPSVEWDNDSIDLMELLSEVRDNAVKPCRCLINVSCN